MKSASSLADMAVGASAEIELIDADDELRQRFAALGLRAGQHLQLLRKAIWGGPLHIRVGTTEVMLRRIDSNRVKIK
jgi:ferrous iron transport protein A